MNNSFSLLALDLRQQASNHILKTLKNTIYVFDRRYRVVDDQIVLQNTSNDNDFCIDLYGKNINIQAIVGKNGSGKSSLLDIIYRVINNLSFSLLTKTQSQLTPLFLINDLYADLYYSVGSQTYTISCKGEQIEWRKVDLLKHTVIETLYLSTWTKEKFEFKTLIEKSKDLFYVIVTNYSPQSLVSNEYKAEKVSFYYQGKLRERRDASWMPSLFHKNDGYLTPICLAPYREDNGAINISKELRLTTYRLSSIFLYYEYSGKKDTLIDNYSLCDIRYEFRPTFSKEKFQNYNGESRKPITYVSNKSIAKLILELFGVYDGILLNRHKIYRSCCEYLTAKVLTIVDTYQSYARYRKLFFKNNSTTKYDVQISISGALPPPANQELLRKLIEQLIKDKSHITIKLRQVLGLLQYILKCKKQNMDDSWLTAISTDFSFKTYIEEVHNNPTVDSIESMQALLPPPIFDVKIFLNKENSKKEDNILLCDLSSGEKQMLCVLSTLVYHVLNLISIAKETDRVSYRNIMIMLDEVEICFHPDYQRQFITRLVTALHNLGLTKECAFYILLATHSPFILSDICQRNILYLKEGEDVSKTIKVNPFCANVNDILDQSFFMEKGFSGEFAASKVRELIKYLDSNSQRSHSGWTKDSAEYFIKQMIGDPIIQSALLAMFNKKFYG